jgi:hypothetical protein
LQGDGLTESFELSDQPLAPIASHQLAAPRATVVIQRRLRYDAHSGPPQAPRSEGLRGHSALELRRSLHAGQPDAHDIFRDGALRRSARASGAPQADRRRWTLSAAVPRGNPPVSPLVSAILR